MTDYTNLTDAQRKLYKILKQLIQYGTRSEDLKVELEEASDDDLEKVLTATKLLSYAISSGDPEHLESILKVAKRLLILEKVLASVEVNDHKKVKTILEGNDILNEVNQVLNSIITKKLHSAAKDGDLGAVQTVLQEVADINQKDENGRTALYTATLKNHLGIVKALLDEGANVDILTNNGYNALHTATVNNYLEIVKVLLDEGANVDILTNNGYTALHTAARHGYLEIVQALLDKGANVHATDKDGRTALDWAETNHHSEVARVLKKAALSKVDNNNNKAPKNEVLHSTVKTAIPSVTSENHAVDSIHKNEAVGENSQVSVSKPAEEGKMPSVTSENGDDSTVNQGSTTNKPIIIGSVCGVIAALAVGVGCGVAGVALPILAIAVAAALGVGLIAGGITYAVSKPNSVTDNPDVDNLDVAKKFGC